MPYFEYKSKKVYYEEIGNGIPTIFLHGNTASSKMFSRVVPFFSANFRVVLLDFLGNGKSERLEKFPIDLWYDEALQVIELIEIQNYKKVNLLGTSGGALVAINVALERPDLINKIIADSFEGEFALATFASNIQHERDVAKTNPEIRNFYYYNHGDDWENIVNNDTVAIRQHYISIKRFFHKSVTNLECDFLFTGSEGDSFMPGDFFEHTYSALIQKIGHGEKYIFKSGDHPAMISNTASFADIAIKFFNK